MVWEQTAKRINYSWIIGESKEIRQKYLLVQSFWVFEGQKELTINWLNSEHAWARHLKTKGN